MTNYIVSIFFIVILFFSAEKVSAQYASHNSAFEVGMDIGGMVSLSPLTPYGRLGAWKQIHLSSIDFFIQKPIIGPLAIRGKLFTGKYGEDDTKTQGYSNWDWFREYRKVKFETDVTEITGMLVWNLFGNKRNSNNQCRWSAYVFAGAGIAFVNVHRDWSKMDTAYFAVENPSLLIDLAKDTTHALPNKAFIMPMGGGARYALSSKFSLLFEANFRYTKQQFLDGFYNVGNNQKNEGYNLKKDDYYYGVTIGIAYKLHMNSRADYGSTDCPKVIW